MRDSIGSQYDQLIDAGISIKPVYIYSLIIEDDRSYGMSEPSINELVDKIINAQFSTEDSLEVLVDRFLNGDGDEGDDDLWLY